MSKPATGGVYAGQGLSQAVTGKAHQGNAKVRTGPGKSRRPGSQGDLQGRGQDGTRTEAQREIAGFATVALRCRAHCISIPTVTPTRRINFAATITNVTTLPHLTCR